MTEKLQRLALKTIEMYGAERVSDLGAKAAQAKISEQCHEEKTSKQPKWTHSKRHEAAVWRVRWHF
jgi:hypothetical protein